MSLWLLYLIALIEWFSTLAVQIITIRMAAPVVGSSIVLTSVFIGVILLALSAGYYVWWALASKYSTARIQRLLFVYLLFASLRYLFITFRWEVSFLSRLLQQLPSYILALFVTAVCLLFIPVFTASQTIPLLTELSPERSKGKAAGGMLFASTIGSFLGSVVTSIVLFQHLGVSLTATVSGSILIIAAWLVVRPKKRYTTLICIVSAVIIWIIAHQLKQSKDPQIVYSYDSPYQNIAIRVTEWWNQPVKIFHTNDSFASWILTETKKSPFSYIREAVTITEQLQPAKVLVIWAAWFVYPYEISKIWSIERIDTVDIDPHVKRIAEQHFLPEPLWSNIAFYAQSARGFVRDAIERWSRYDLIFVDAFHGRTIPDELTTKEFFDDLNQISSGVIMSNLIMDSDYSSSFATNLLTTLDTTLSGAYLRKVSKGSANGLDNFVVVNEPIHASYQPVDKAGKVYTDDHRSTEIDIVQMFWGL